jgi:hypothetical protein
MPNALTTVTNLINSPPGQLVAGGVLAGIVWKFFERVEAVLTDDTKLEIAVWLVGIEPEQTARGWRRTLAIISQAVFHGSPDSARRQIADGVIGSATFALAAWTWFASVSAFWPPPELGKLLVFIGFGLAILFICITSVRLGIDISFLADSELDRSFALNLAITPLVRVLLNWAVVTILTAVLENPTITVNQPDRAGWAALASASILPALMTVFPHMLLSWLPLVGGGMIIAARRFDIGFQWFNRRFDIEKKPLQSIGLVAGALVAVVYWTAVIVSRVFSHV